MNYANLSTGELQELLMEKTKQLTSAIREGTPLQQREELRKQIQVIQQLLEMRSHPKPERERPGSYDMP